MLTTTLVLALASATPAQATINGLVLLAEPAQAQSAGWTQVPSGGLDVSRLSAATAAVLHPVLQAHVGRQADGAALNALVADANRALAASARPFAVVSLPRQTSSNGVIQLLVTESRLGAIKVVGTSASAEASYRQALRQRAGEPIDKAQLDADVAWINRNPFREATALAAPGGQFGTTNLTLMVKERRPWSFSARADDSGTDQTDPVRVGLGATWGDAFGRGDILNYQLTASPDFKATVGHALGLQSFLPWKHILSLSGSYSTIEGELPAPFTLEGYSWSASAQYEVPMASNQALVFGLDMKRSNNNFRFSNLPINENTTDVIQASAGWSGQFPDALGGTAAGVNLAVSPGGLGARNDRAAYRLTRAGADPRYAVLRVSLERNTALPSGWRLQNALRGQLTTAALIGSEQLSIGGWSSIRGYDEGAYYGDRGLVLRNELSAPVFAVGAVRTRAYGFADLAVFGNLKRLAGEDRWNTAHTVGLGFETALAKNVSLRASWGVLVGGQVERAQSSRGHIGLTATF